MALAVAVPGVAAAASRWTFQPVPLPAGDTGALSGVTCSSATNCLAVGAIDSNGDALGEHWDGSTWTAQDIPVPGSSSASLSAVSYASADSCTAVGMYLSGTENKISPLAEHWDGSTWAGC
jgi:hypothetical protein